MEEERWQKLQQLFEGALAQPEAKRDAFLVAQCGARGRGGSGGSWVSGARD